MERVRPRCLLLSHRLTDVHSPTEGQCSRRVLPHLIPVTSLFPCLFRYGAAIYFLLLLASECFNHPLLVSFMPSHSLVNIRPFKNVSKFFPFEYLAASLSEPWLIALGSRNGPRPKYIKMTFCQWMVHVWREQDCLLTREIIESW